MTRFGFSAALLIAAAPAAAQQAAAPAPAGGAEIQQAATAFGQCIQTGAQGVAATVTPEAGAASVLSGCAGQRAALERAAEAMINSPAVPADKKAVAREQLRSQMAAVPTKIADGIRMMRAGAAAPTTAPTQPKK